MLILSTLALISIHMVEGLQCDISQGNFTKVNHVHTTCTEKDNMCFGFTELKHKTKTLQLLQCGKFPPLTAEKIRANFTMIFVGEEVKVRVNFGNTTTEKSKKNNDIDIKPSFLQIELGDPVDPHAGISSEEARFIVEANGKVRIADFKSLEQAQLCFDGPTGACKSVS